MQRKGNRNMKGIEILNRPNGADLNTRPPFGYGGVLIPVDFLGCMSGGVCVGVCVWGGVDFSIRRQDY